ncbi:MAG: HD domain-containing protein [Planctomycetes bacterium]|nr:HD domain-containing protein [Planctomycetota bacterium]
MFILENLLEVGRKLYALHDPGEMLDTILTYARAMTNAEGGSLFLLQDDRLKFVAVQNDRIDTSSIAENLLSKEMPVSMESLAGFVALTGQIMNIPDTYHMLSETSFAINRDFDLSTGYKTQSLLALPLNCPDGSCIGVMQLINHIGPDGQPGAFGDPAETGVLPLASSAAITVHNAILQEQLRQAHYDTIYRLSVVAEYRDGDTGEHIQRVSRTGELVARALGLDPSMVKLIKHASHMHDVGKVAIPDAILLKAGYLTSEQRESMQKHTLIGGEILAQSDDDVLAMGYDIALHHHERWDGKGYPNGLKGDDIPLAARIICLADVFDAVVSRRCYKSACTLDMALRIVNKDKGYHFDPDVADAFLSVLDEIGELYAN